jgi:dTDP-4-amino-4,6-dideoxygalactose transaminase
MMKIPFMRLDRQYSNITDEITSAVETVFSTGRVLQSDEVKKLEQDIASIHNLKYGIAVNSGTDALVIALKVAGLKQGDKVAVTSLSFVASASAIVLAGGIPVFVDIDQYFQADCNQLLALIARKEIDGIVAVHLYGQIMELDELLDKAGKNNIYIIEDAAQAFGATYNGAHPGKSGVATCVSFDPTKVVGAYGSGGMILTDNDDLKDRAVQLRYHGHTGNRIYQNIGHNSQLASVQAAILLVKIKYYKKWEKKRILIAEQYSELLKGISEIETPKVAVGNKHIFHKYVLRVNNKRDELQRYLKDKGIGTSVHYSMPLYKQPCFNSFINDELEFQHVEHACETILSLPIYPELTNDEVQYIIGTIIEFYK